jgi:hypothetical protein
MDGTMNLMLSSIITADADSASQWQTTTVTTSDGQSYEALTSIDGTSGWWVKTTGGSLTPSEGNENPEQVWLVFFDDTESNYGHDY